ncbi:MAG: thioredoxin family protein [Formivibrio sp.]|nr:thioredoxin family protein [Formivibrio sp.]
MSLAYSAMLPLGAALPEFTLLDGEGNPFSLSGLAGQKGLLVVFICNHCPYVLHINPALAPLGKELAEQGVGMVAISSNDISRYPEDAPERMVEFARGNGYTFPYLYDADQNAAKAFHAACTPDLFLFDADLNLVYRGRFDATRPNQGVLATGADLKHAVATMVAGKPPLAQQLPSAGCSIKWR